MKNILYFSLVTWKWIKQRPHFVSYYLANNNYNVTYLSKHPVASGLKNKTLFVKNEVYNENLKIKNINILPLENKISLIYKINSYRMKSQFNKDYELIILTHPTQYDMVKSNKSKLIYECMDNIPEFSDDPDVKQKLINQEMELAKAADKIIVSSDGLKNKFINKYNIQSDKIVTIYNGFDKESFDKINDKYVELKPKNVVYIGTISEWLDIEYIYKFAEENKDFNLYIIGPIETKVLDKIRYDIDNVKFTGPIEHSDIHKYIDSGDVMLIPFKINELIKSVDPVKAYEYLYYKKPVVSSYWNEMEKFSKYMYFYNNYEEFDKSIKEAYEKGIKSVDNLEELIENSSWQNRMKKYLDAIESII